MAVTYLEALRHTRLDAIDTAIGASGVVRIYDGSPPADVDAALSGNTLLATCPFSATAFGAAAAGIMTANAITDDSSADATGTASFFRLLTSGFTAQVQGSVGAGSGDLDLNTVSIVIAATVSITSMVITAGN